MTDKQSLYLVLLAGIPVAVFTDKYQAEMFRIRQFANLHFDSALLNLLSYREIPATLILEIKPNRDIPEMYLFSEGIVLQRYSRNALKASLNFNEDLNIGEV